MRKTLFVAAMLAVMLPMRAQYVTYNHDETKMNQVLVMETGAGTLTPALYYRGLHESYSRTAAARNKLTYRTQASAAMYRQAAMAEKLDSSLTARARVAALDLTDQTVDLAWEAEGGRTERRLADLERGIALLTSLGATQGERERWTEQLSLLRFRVTHVRTSFMPNSERKSQYESIYRDADRQVTLLVSTLARKQALLEARRALSSTLTIETDNASIAVTSRDRWRQGITPDND